MNCKDSTCCKCKLKDLEMLCQLAKNNFNCDFEILVERLKRNIFEYDERKS